MNKYYEAYDQRYKIIHGKGYSWSSDTPTPIVSDVISKYNLPFSSILEIGCGEGRDALFLLQKGYNVTASDISAEAVNYCKRLMPKYRDHFIILDCLHDHLASRYDFIYSIAVIHMLVNDEDRNGFYRFIYNHLNDNGLALICSMGDGVNESMSDISKAFDMVERNHDSGSVIVPSTSLRMMGFNSFEKEIRTNHFDIIEKGITSSLPDFNNLMYAIVEKHE